jgi:hypothetical protein
MPRHWNLIDVHLVPSLQDQEIPELILKAIAALEKRFDHFLHGLRPKIATREGSIREHGIDELFT